MGRHWGLGIRVRRPGEVAGPQVVAAGPTWALHG
jgi:hypothetical protein